MGPGFPRPTSADCRHDCEPRANDRSYPCCRLLPIRNTQLVRRTQENHDPDNDRPARSLTTCQKRLRNPIRRHITLDLDLLGAGVEGFMSGKSKKGFKRGYGQFDAKKTSTGLCIHLGVAFGCHLSNGIHPRRCLMVGHHIYWPNPRRLSARCPSRQQATSTGPPLAAFALETNEALSTTATAAIQMMSGGS